MLRSTTPINHDSASKDKSNNQLCHALQEQRTFDLTRPWYRTFPLPSTFRNCCFHRHCDRTFQLRSPLYAACLIETSIETRFALISRRLSVPAWNLISLPPRPCYLTNHPPHIPLNGRYIEIISSDRLEKSDRSNLMKNLPYFDVHKLSLWRGTDP